MKQTTHQLVLTCLATALIAVLAQISLPIGPVPFSLLTVGIGLVASLLKTREALLAGLLYLTLGGLGLPIFANFSGGFQHLVGPTGGYLWGILLYLLLTSRLTKPSNKISQIFMANLIGDSCLFVLGFLGLQYFTGMTAKDAFLIGVLPFTILDIIKISIVSLVVKPIYRAVKEISYFQD